MSPIDRALLIAHSRQDGEETAEVAKRFGVSYSTVRRLEAQLDGATANEVSAIRANNLSLSLHAVIARNVTAKERVDVIGAVSSSVRAKELEELFVAIGWRSLVELGPKFRGQRLQLLRWACDTLAAMPKGEPRERMRQLALQLPLTLPRQKAHKEAMGR